MAGVGDMADEPGSQAEPNGLPGIGRNEPGDHRGDQRRPFCVANALQKQAGLLFWHGIGENDVRD